MDNQNIKQSVLLLFNKFSIEQIALFVDVDLDILYKWKNEYDSFIEALDKEYDSVKDEIKNAKLQNLLCYETLYAHNVKIQSLIVTRYTKLQAYDEAISICKKYPDCLILQNQLITIYMHQSKLNLAIEICKKYPNYDPIQSQLVSIYMRRREYEKAISVCKKHPNVIVLQSQLIKIYTQLGRFDEAINICKKYPNFETIQSQLVTIYKKQNRFDEAIELCRKYLSNEIFQVQLLDLYLQLNKIGDAALMLDKYPNNNIIQTKYNYLRKYIKKIERSWDNNDINNFIITKLLDKTICMDDIEFVKTLENKIDNNTYKFLLIAIYHRLGMIKSALQILKTIDVEYKKQKNKILNVLSCKKSSFYDLGIYDEIINWNEISKVTSNNCVVKVKKD